MTRSYRGPTTALALALLAALAAEAAAAQAAGREDRVPDEFAEVFIPMRAADSVAVGQIPEELAGWILPTGDSRVIGSIVRGNGIMAALAVPARPARAAGEWRRRLVEAGWELPPEPGTTWHAPERGGFVRTTTSHPVLCLGERHSLRITARAAGVGQSHVLFTYRVIEEEQAYRSLCSAAYRERGGFVAPLPTLRPPAGALSAGGGAGGSADRAHAEALVSGAVTARELAEHYGRQMVEQGWTLTEEAVGDQVTLTSWARTDEDGVAWRGSLALIPLDDGLVSARVEARRLPGPPR